LNRITSAKRELGIASKALEEGDRKHAAHHAATAMLYAPRDEAVLAVVDFLIASPAPGFAAAIGRFFGSSKAFAPLFPDDGFAGNMAVRARAHELRGELAEAFGLLLSLAVAVPDGEFLQCAHDLVASDSASVIDERHYLGVFSELAAPTIGLLWLRPTERQFFDGWTTLGLRLLARGASADRRSLAMVVSSMARRAGRLEEAVELAAADSPDELLDIARGLALRALGRVEDARAAFERAGDAKGELGIYALEIGRALFDAGRFAEAREWIKRAPELHGEEQVTLSVIEELVDPARPRFYTRLFGERPAYDAIRRFITGQDVHRPMCDASTNVIPQLEEKPPPLECKLTLSCLESPSALATLALRLSGRPDPLALEYDYGGVVPTPHPFEVLDRKRGVELWRKQGELVAQAVEQPSTDVSDFIDATLRALWAREGQYAPMLSAAHAWKVLRARDDLEQVPPAELFAAMVHPTVPPEWTLTAPWVFDRQVLCALTLAAQDWERPWLGSRRRDNLAGLIFGHPDWTLAAALIALREVVLDDPDALDDGREWVRMLVDAQPSQGHCPWSAALRLFLHLPGMPPELLKKLPDDESETPTEE